MELSKKHFDSLVTKEQAEKTEFFECIDSTNTYLKELSKKAELPAGYCVMANSQTRGKGRLGRSFVSKHGVGIYLSYLFSVEGIPAETVSQLTARSAVAVRNAVLTETGIDCKIKWVNDLVFNGKKLCGILTESVFEAKSGKIKYAVVGVGINVNNLPEDFPEEISNKATSLKIISGKTFKTESLAAAVIKELSALSSCFPENADYYLEEYRKNCATIGKTVTFGSPERVGIAADITDTFALKIAPDIILNAGEASVKGMY